MFAPLLRSGKQEYSKLSQLIKLVSDYPVPRFLVGATLVVAHDPHVHTSSEVSPNLGRVNASSPAGTRRVRCLNIAYK